MQYGSRLIVFLCLLPLLVHAQNVQIYDPQSPTQNPAPHTALDTVAPATSEIDPNDPVTEAELDRAKVSKQYGQLAETSELPGKVADEVTSKGAARVDELGIAIDKNLLDLQSELNSGKSSLDILNDPALRAKLIKAYENNPMSQLPKEQLRPLVEQQIQQTPLKGVTKTFPKVLDFIVNLMHDPKALGQLVKMLNRPDDLKMCGYVSLALFIFIFALRKVLIRPKTRGLQRIGITLATSVLLFGGSLGYLWATFHEELGPAVRVVGETFF